MKELIAYVSCFYSYSAIPFPFRYFFLYECHFIVFIAMLIKFHLDFFYSLCCASLFLSYLCKFFSSFFYIHTYSLLHHYTYLYYKREFDYAKNDRSAFNEDEYKLCAFNVALWRHVAVYSLYILVYEYDTNHLY